MSFSNTLDAQTQAVNAVISRKALETQLSMLNDGNDPTKTLRLAKKIQIKNVQVILDSANSYLVANRIPALIYNPLLVSSDGFVSSTWTNEKDVPNTVLNSIPTTAVNIGELQQIHTDVQVNIDTVSKSLSNDRKVLKELLNAPDSAIKTVLLSETQSDIELSSDVIKELVDTKQNIEQIINKSQDDILAPHPLPDIFSQSIRKDLHDRLVQKVGYDASKNDDEATIIMRKKALDAFYTAKTPGEKAEALDRLNRTAAAMDPNVPITRETYQFDPLAFSKLHVAIDIADAELLALRDQLVVARGTNDPVQISAAQAAYDLKNKEKINLIDTLKGFRDSPLSIASYPGSHHIVAQSGPAISTPASSETNEFNDHRQQQDSHNVTPDTRYYDLEKQQFVEATQVDATQSGKYVSARDVTNDDVENYQYTKAVAGYNSDYDRKTAALRTSTSNAYGDLTIASAHADEQKVANNTQISALQKNPSPENDARVAALVKQNAVLDDVKTQAVKNYQDIQSQNQITANNEKAVLDQQIQNRTAQKDTVIKQDNVYASVGEAKAVTAYYQDSKAASDNAQVGFNKSYELAVENARSNGAKDPADPANWSASDRATVTQKQTDLQSARAVETKAATDFNVYATQVPDGQKTLLQSGLTDAQIKQLNANAAIDRNNNGGVQDQTKAGFSNTANSIDDSNIRPANGFEQINNGAPFYMQFPTLKAIKDFRLRNGISPYGQQDTDEIARNAIHFNIFEVTPPAARATLVPGTAGLIRNEVEAAKSNTIGSFTIYPSNQELSMTHSHSYDDDLGIAKFLQTGLDIVNGADTLLTFGAAAIGSLAEGKEVSVAQRLQRRIESIDKYQGTEKQSMTTEFNLFTKNDFLHDIFRPIMFLTALSYPKRNLTGNLGDDIKRLDSASKELAEKNSTIKVLLDNAKKIMPNITAQQARDFTNNIEQAITQTGGIGPFRYFITKNPEYISVRHASGLFYLPLAVILGVEYTFEGPWYNYNGDIIETPGNLDEIVRVGLSNSTSNRSFKEIFADIKQPFTSNPFAVEGNRRSGPQGTLPHLAGLNKNDPFITKYKLPFAYPTSAKCVIRYKSAVSQFRDDYMRLFYQAGTNGGAGLVTVTEEQTATVNDSKKREF